MNIILTGATGMVGEGVLHECLQSPEVARVLVINRQPCGTVHPKLEEIIHPDFFHLEPIADRLRGYDACLFCLGVSSVGKKEPEYFRLTYVLTLHLAGILAAQNKGMTFCYISGAGTDSTEEGPLMWARIKGKTENDLGKLAFKAVYHFRPGVLEPTKGMKNTLALYRYLGWLLPLFRIIYPKGICTLRQLGRAMIHAADSGYEKSILEVKDIKRLAAR